MTVYILDDDTQQQSRRDWPFLTGETQLRLVGRNGHKLTTLPGGQELAADASGVVFIHSSYCPPSELQHISGNYQKLVLILVSAGGILNGPCGSLFWSVGKAVSKPPVRDDYFAERAKDFLADYRRTGKPDFQKLEPDLEPQLAFRLLCEAKQVCGDQDEKKCHNITIHAPKRIEDWLTPFSPIGNDDAEKITAVASMVGSDAIMGKAAAVLNAVKDNNNVDEAIKAFLDHRELSND